jgi:hypothetical protein
MTLQYSQQYLEDVMGMVSDNTQMAFQRWSQKAGEKFYNIMQKSRLIPKGVKAKMQLQDMFSIMQGLTVAATMAGRMWMPLRNMQQIWTMLAPRLGMGGGRIILEAFDRVNKNGDQIARHLRATGRLTGEVPVFGYKAEGMVGQFNRLGMRLHKNSDDFNRMITDQAVDIMMEDGAKRFLRGQINEKQFLDLTNLRRMDSESQKLVVNTLQQKGYTAAKDLYGDILTRETQVLYREGAAPSMFRRSQFGKLFGMFGQYPTYYLENIRRGLRNGTTADKMVFAGATMAYGAGLYSLFEGLGIRGDDFLPWKQMFFTGGPYFNFLIDAKRSLGGEPGALPLRSLPKEASRLFVPGSSQLRAVQKMVEYQEQGDSYSAMLSLMTLPAAD